MTPGIHRNAQVIIDEKALYDNIHEEKLRLPDNTQLFMVVKANGYGHGAVEVAKVAKKAGATGFCVAILDEALELRQAGFVEPILVLGLTSPSYVNLIVENGISVTVSSIDWIKDAEKFLNKNQNKRLLVHLGLDTGMGRIGFNDRDSLRLAIQELNDRSDMFEFEGIYTHFATADSLNPDYFDSQLARFNQLMEVVDKKPKYVHVANSAAGLWHQKCGGNVIRFGIAGYGLDPSANSMKLPYPLTPAMSVTSEVDYCKKVPAGSSIGYGATYTTEQDEWIGTVPIGYADGVSRDLQNFYVLVEGNYCQIVGRVCMDQLMIRLPYEVSIGTKVTLVGENGSKQISLQNIADYCGTIHYEVACRYSDRLPRIYINRLNQ